MSLPPFKFTPWLKTVVWGGTHIAEFKGLDTDLEKVGESWEVSALPGMESVVAEGDDRGLKLTDLIRKYGASLVGETIAEKAPEDFPLLIKFIDAHDNLSLQVHPDNELAAELHNCGGKSEMWYIIDNAPGANIYAGFARKLSPDDYEDHVKSGEILDDVARHVSAPGHIYFLPAGCIHAIGAGNFLIEIQQSSDITYRVYDYNRPDDTGRLRPLHVAQAKRALDFASASGYSPATAVPERKGVSKVVDCDFFNVKRVDVDGMLEIILSHIKSFVTFTCIDGTISIVADNHNPMELHRGETAMVAASVDKVVLKGSGSAISASVPE